VSYVGPVGPEERDNLLGGASALLHLIDFDEPVGLAVVEALATGTPVIARPRGSMPELLRPGVTGFLVGDGTSAVAAVSSIGDIDRAVCRAEAVARFSADRMVDDYDRLFDSILEV
jgi:glycosyltransferase involved in cell wall biosynthesis